jgi:hypothetical protein
VRVATRAAVQTAKELLRRFDDRVGLLPCEPLARVETTPGDGDRGDARGLCGLQRVEREPHRQAALRGHDPQPASLGAQRWQHVEDPGARLQLRMLPTPASSWSSGISRPSTVLVACRIKARMIAAESISVPSRSNGTVE